MKTNKFSHNTIANYSLVLTKLNEFKPLETITEQDLNDFFNSLSISDNYYILHQVIIKKFFSDIGKKDLVKWIKKKTAKETLKSDDILNTADINKMIEATSSPYYKALIAVLFETGARINEVRSLKYGDFKDTNEKLIIVHIPTTKTAAGYRKMLLPFSGQYVRNLKLYSNKKDEDIVFHVHEWQTNHMIRDIAKKAGITKPISCHKFRHAQATDLVRRGMQEAVIRKKMGWTPASGMIARYQHLNDNDVIDAEYDLLGETHKAPIREELKKATVEATPLDNALKLAELEERNKFLESLVKQIAEKVGIKEEGLSELKVAPEGTHLWNFKKKQE